MFLDGASQEALYAVNVVFQEALKLIVHGYEATTITSGNPGGCREDLDVNHK